MRDTDLYARILGVQDPWMITDVRLDMSGEQVEITLAHRSDASLRCPECGTAGSGYDTRSRRWRHLDTCQYRTILIADVPRVRCAVHGVRQVAVPLADWQIGA